MGTLLPSLTAMAQTATWVLQPSDFSRITYLGKDVFKVHKADKVGLFSASGKMIAPCQYDSLTDFHESTALLLQSTAKGMRVVGCLDSNGAYHAFGKNYYTLQGQDFYSDHVLSVANEQGRLGYIDIMGTEVVGFDGRFDRIKPFSEGYAAVFKNKKYSLIDKSGAAVRFYFNTVGELYGGTNVYQGNAYVWDTDGVFYTYDTQRGGACKKIKLPSSDRSFDYLYRLSCISGSDRTVPTKRHLEDLYRTARAIEHNGLWGYERDNESLLYPQFEAATHFMNDYAIVRSKGKLGILRYSNQASVVPATDHATVSYYGSTAACDFFISVPHDWAGKDINAQMTTIEGKPIDLTSKGELITFKFSPIQPEHTFQIILDSEGLILFKGTLTYKFVHKEKCLTCGLDVTQCRFKGRHPVEQHKVVSTPKPSPKENKSQKTTTPKAKLCPTCGKPITQCKYQGVH